MLPVDPASGIKFRRITGFKGRSDNMVKLRGVNIYPDAIGELLQAVNGVTGEYVCRLDRSATGDEMTVIVEHGDIEPPVPDRLSEDLSQQLGVRISVKLVGPGATAALTGLEERQKPKRLIDLR